MTLNLVQHRSGSSTWDRETTDERDLERWLVAMMSAAFLVAGFRRRGIPGLLLSMGGSSLAYWAATGADTRLVRRAQLKQVWPRGKAAQDLVHEASEESFPASDAPSWTPTTGNR